MKSLRYLCLGTLTLLGACNQDQPSPACTGACTTIRGRLLTSQPQVGLSGAQVVAQWLKPAGSNYSVRDKARTTTSADGTFEVSFYLDDNEVGNGFCEVAYKVDKNQYYTIGEPLDAVYSVKRDTVIRLAPYHIPRQAIANITVPNPSQIQGSFSIELTTVYGHNLTLTKNELGSGLNFGVPRQAGPFTYKAATAGDQKVYLRTSKNLYAPFTTSIRTLDSLTIPAGTTRNLTITH